MFGIKYRLLAPETDEGNTLSNAQSLDDIAKLFVDDSDLTVKIPGDEPVIENVEQDDKKVELETPTETSVENPDENVTWGKALGVDDNLVVLDETGNLQGIKAKIDGVEETVPVKDLLNGYRNNRYNTQKSQALAEEFKQFQEAKETVAKSYETKLGDIEQLMNYVKAQFVKDYQGINWEQVRVNNPGEYAALVQDFNLKNAEFDNVLAALEQEKQKLSVTQQQEFKKSLESRQREQMEITLKNNPEWNDPNVMKKAVGDIANFVVDTYGFTQQDFMSINDARIIEVLKDAMKFRTGVREAEKKIVQATPKFQKQSNARQSNVTHLDKLIKKAETSQGPARRQAQTDAIAQLLLNENIKL